MMVTWVLEDGGGVGNDVCLSVTEEVGGNALLRVLKLCPWLQKMRLQKMPLQKMRRLTKVHKAAGWVRVCLVVKGSGWRAS
ncbi:hypothetical protein [Bartonella machadoae]|uniref:hypothetical protein n=1 Tax=Bartonella machadoae TaxID=2893471 RepID=UPI001F4C9DB7|nr:hypothetical protein [Bartonella machadoae]UNE53838.1 hypothetical protein LNM86_09555 [Bartonella machadoae]